MSVPSDTVQAATASGISERITSRLCGRVASCVRPVAVEEVIRRTMSVICGELIPRGA